MGIHAVTDQDFEAEVLQADGPVLVDFWAEWCGPCKVMGATLDQLAGDMGGKIKIAKVNIEDSPESPTKYGVRAIPTLILFKNGEIVAEARGAMSKDDCKKWIEQNI
ncbi:MAG: thioredoxin [Micavibrio sp.]|nr:MAG: thioredoxin [Micavibrio sp.]